MCAGLAFRDRKNEKKVINNWLRITSLTGIGCSACLFIVAAVLALAGAFASPQARISEGVGTARVRFPQLRAPTQLQEWYLCL